MSASRMPEPESVNVAPATNAYLGALQSLSILEGGYGDAQTLQSGAEEVLIALHHVLAGGTVSVEIQNPGTASVVEELNELLQNAVNETKQLVDHPLQVNF